MTFYQFWQKWQILTHHSMTKTNICHMWYALSATLPQRNIKLDVWWHQSLVWFLHMVLPHIYPYCVSPFLQLSSPSAVLSQSFQHNAFLHKWELKHHHLRWSDEILKEHKQNWPICQTMGFTVYQNKKGLGTRRIRLTPKKSFFINNYISEIDILLFEFQQWRINKSCLQM